MTRKKRLWLVSLALLLLATTPGCIGNFALSHEVWSRNKKIDNKVGREAAFVALLIVPVYEVAMLADLLVFNTCELFTDENLWGQSTSESRPDAEP